PGCTLFPYTTLFRSDDLSRLTKSGSNGSPIVYNTYRLESQPVYIQVAKGQLAGRKYNKKDLSERYDAAEQMRLALAKRVKLKTPDRYLNTFGGALAVAADGVWESPTFLHGAVAWRMRLIG